MKKINSEKEIKCVVWDLDNTIWDGILLESNNVTIKPYIKEIILELDSRGILNSIASRNNYDDVIEKLEELKINEYFLFPQINWNPKSESIKKIQQNLNIGMDSILFIDDQHFEMDEVLANIPEVNVIDACYYLELLNFSQLKPRFITQDSRRRRLMYLEDINRNRDEQNYIGPKEEFLASLNMKLTISEAIGEDLQRAEELTIRTNQLNATGKTYSYDELYMFMNSDKHKLLVCELDDKYGSYCKIGLALIEISDTHWHLHLLLMSCRVLSRSIGSVFLSYIMNETKNRGKKLLADFKQTNKNKLMYATYKFANFMEISNDGEGNIVFENDLKLIQKYPPYINLTLPNLN